MKNIRSIFLVVLMLACIGIWSGVWINSGTSVDASNIAYGDVKVIPTIDQTSSEVPQRFVKVEYIPVIPEGSNIAEDAIIDANGFNDVYMPVKVKDGNVNAASYWEGAVDSYPNIITASYLEGKIIHAIRLRLCPLSIWSRRIQTFSVWVSEDGETFTELIPSKDYDFDPDTGNEVVLEFDEVCIKAIRLEFTQNTGAVGAQLAEFEIYAIQ